MLQITESDNWEASGLQCRAIKHPGLGHWCGYVALPAGHKFHGKHYDDIEVDVHGGLTYAEDHAPHDKPDGQWWVGFDCAHAGDLIPGARLGRAAEYETFKDLDFIKTECGQLSKQLVIKD